MKKTAWLIVIGAILGALVMAVLFKVVGPMLNQSAVKNSFYEVTGKLDTGGEIYLYAHTERILQKIDQTIEKIKSIAAKSATGEAQQTLVSLSLFQRVLSDIGIGEISGIGYSSIAREKDLFRDTFVVHHFPDKSRGLIWNLGPAAPRVLDEIGFLPADTVAASSMDIDPQKLWEWILREADALKIPEFKQGLQSFGPQLLAQGVDLTKLLGGLSGRFGVLLTLDREKHFAVPIQGSAVSIPEPALALFISVKDSYLFDLLKGKLPVTQKSEEKGVKKLFFPPIPLPFAVEPVIVQKGEWLIVASHPRLAEAMTTADKKKQRLADSEEYKKISDGLPSRGNGFRYLSPRLMQSAMAIMQKVVESNAGEGSPDTAIREIMDLLPKDLAFCGVTQSRNDGMVFTFNHNSEGANAIMLPAIAGVGIVSAIAIPNLLTALQKGKQKATMADMRSITLALTSYMVDNGKLPEGDSLADFKAKLEPFYIKALPLKDAWGNDFLFSRGSSADTFMIASPGKDGEFKGWDQRGAYAASAMIDFYNDIIMTDAEFVLYPEIKK